MATPSTLETHARQGSRRRPHPDGRRRRRSSPKSGPRSAPDPVVLAA